MGLLSQGKPLDWDETKKYAKVVQEKGIDQFINVYNASKHRADAPFKWGDEVEYILVKFDHHNRKARVALKAEEVFHKIQQQHRKSSSPKSFWNPEFGSYMVEGTPGSPYGVNGDLLSSLCDIEPNMRYRRFEVEKALKPDECVMSITNFPRLGCDDFTHPPSKPRPETSASGSLFFPDEAIYGGHPRFKTLVKNIRSRRRRKVIINLPIYKDTHTPSPFVEMFNDPEARVASKPDHVYMDAMGFGMGCCCLQITFQATHLEEAKVLYDQLAPLTPIALALSAGSPVYRGYLTDRDCRWDVISAAVDCRTREESAETPELKESEYRIPKSRYASISTYLSKKAQQYNDLPLVYNRNFYDIMMNKGVDHAVARHIAHLFIRDPVTLYKEKLNQSDSEMDHFENIQSTNWQTMRFKPPPHAQSPIGWRVEFRPFEAQTTEFENAAYVVFVTLLTRVILACKLNFLMPISLVDENMVLAQERDAINRHKFWFRRDIMHRGSSKEPLATVLENCCCSTKTPNCRAKQLANKSSSSYNNSNNNNSNAMTADSNIPMAPNNINTDRNEVTQMSIDEIINGSDSFVGIMPILWHYVESLDDGGNTDYIDRIKTYLRFISDRAASRIKTTAQFMRDFIDSHPAYKHDSRVDDEIAYDLLSTMNKITRGEVHCPELTGDLTSKSDETSASSLATHKHTCLMDGTKSCKISNGFRNIFAARKSPLAASSPSAGKQAERATKSAQDHTHMHTGKRSISR